MHKLHYIRICAISPMVDYVLPLNNSLLDIPLLQPCMPSMHHSLHPPPLFPNERRVFTFIICIIYYINNRQGVVTWLDLFEGLHCQQSKFS